MSEYIRFLDTVTVLLKLFSPLCFHVWPQDGNVGLSHINHASPVSDSTRSPKHFHDLYSLPQITHSLSRYGMHKICTRFSSCHNHHGAETRISQFLITSNR